MSEPTADNSNPVAASSQVISQAEKAAIGLNLRGGAAQTLNLLEGKINTETAEKLRKEAGVRKFSDPRNLLNISDTDELITIIEAESIEVSAIII